MDRNDELPTVLRRAAQRTGYEGSDALSWRQLLEHAADEIDRLRTIVEHDNDSRPGVETSR